MDHQVYAARTPQDLKILSQKHGDVEITAQLGPKDRKSPASRWNIRHLIAYRLLIKEEKNEVIVPIFKTDHEAQCPVCNQEAICSQQLNEDAYQSLIGLGPRNLYGKSESELMRLPDGFFWVALSRAARPPEKRTSGFPSREKKQVQWDGYINSTDAIPGSSSPISYSSSEFDGEMDTLSELDEDEHYSRRSKPEELTVQLITSFFQHALNLCLVQPLSGISSNIDVQPRIKHEKATASISGEAHITAEDDGGICAMLWCYNGWRMIHPYLALLEAKRAFQIIHLDDKTGISHPITSNEHLAQYLGEAVIAWKGRQEIFNNDVFLIAATSTFVSFIHFTFGRDYLDYLDADGVTQWEIIHDEDKEAFVYMSSTKWLNLQSGEGRRVTLCNILALLRWHHAQGSFESEPPMDPDDNDHEAIRSEGGAISEDNYDDENGSGMDTDTDES